DMTGTGYPIYMTSHPDVAFKTYVEGVSSRVCKNVVNMNLNGIVKGIQFVQVNGTKYIGNASICGEDKTDNTIVFTSFLDSENNEIGTGQSGDPCVEDMDCTSLCGTATCNADKMTCQNDCTGSANPHCFDNNGTGVCVECLANKDCPNEQICDLANHKCVDIPKTCGEGGNFGKEYRAANGSCVSCDYMSEIIIMNSDDNDGIFEKQVGGVSIKDTHSGIEMCQACASIQHRIEEAGRDGNIKTYCATSCVKGNSYLDSTGKCIPCDSTTESNIPNDDKAHKLCDACSNRTVLDDTECILKTCPDGYFKGGLNSMGYGRCRACNNAKVDCYSGNWPNCYDFFATIMWQSTMKTSASNMLSEWSAQCEQCGSATDPDYRQERMVLHVDNIYICVKKCKSGQFYSNAGNCLDCDYPESVALTGLGITGNELKQYLRDLCEACGRTYKDGYCLPLELDTCEDGKEFKGKNAKCYPCTTSIGRVAVDSDEESKCTDNCGNERVYSDGFCFKKCQANEYLAHDGTGDSDCYPCSHIGDGQMVRYEQKTVEYENKLCTSCGVNQHRMWSYRSTQYCVPVACGQNKIRKNNGICTSCLTSSGTISDIISQTECEKCPNHIYLNGYCVYVSAGQSGICNNDSPDTSKYPNFSPVGLKYRDNTGICRSCLETNKGYEATAEECASCGGIRTLIGGKCMYGGCLQNDTFMSTSGCPSCDATGAVTIPDKTEAEQLCHDCNRRIMMRVDELKYCVQTCDAGEWQDINGDCWGSEIDVGSNEIGIDELSAQLCRNASRTPTKDNETGRVYCQQ
ncbi:MAG: hypothetical protein IJY58_04460, partial [Alphaproteobacteria bacterium]|nr:hypothetical protein [Alphaproteobacteria bacterium]